MKARSRRGEIDSGSEWTHRSWRISTERGAEVFLTLGNWSVHPSGDILGWSVFWLKVKGCAERLCPHSSQGLFFISSLYIPHSFSHSLSGPQLSAEPLLLSPSLWTARLPSSVYLYTLIIGHHLPDLSLTSLHSTQQPVNTPLSLSTGTLAQKPATAAISFWVTHLSSLGMFYAL